MLKEIGRVLARYREEMEVKFPKEWSQTQVAEKMGKKRLGFISRIEIGKDQPSLKYIGKLLKLYEKSEADFFHDVAGEYLDRS